MAVEREGIRQAREERRPWAMGTAPARPAQQRAYPAKDQPKLVRIPRTERQPTSGRSTAALLTTPRRAPAGPYPAARSNETREVQPRSSVVAIEQARASERPQPSDARKPAWELPEREGITRAREEIRPGRLVRGAREMTNEEYAGLSDRQKAAVQFNTGMVRAAEADGTSKDGEHKREFLNRIGITSRSEADLDSFLKLDQLIGDSILTKLDDAAANQSSAATLRWSRGKAPAGGQAQQFASARRVADQTAEALAGQLGSTGRRSVTDTEDRPGFGGTLRDAVIVQAYGSMVDADLDFQPQDIVDGIAMMNAEAGTDVSPQEVWDYARAQLEATQFQAAGNNAPSLFVPEVDLSTGEPITIKPLDIAEIRRRYGI